MKWMEEELASLAQASCERRLKEVHAVAGQPGYLVRRDRTLLNLSSNDYLGLSQHRAIADAMREALAAGCGSGAGASRLVTGNRNPYRELEQELAQWQQCEASLVFPNGYMANQGVISALVGRDDIVFSDRLNHASIVDGITLSRAEHARYRHNDMEHLESLLRKHSNARRKIIVTDAIFSMDGDAAPLEKLVELKHKYGAMLLVDEAHSGGIFAANGEGLCHALLVHQDVDIHMGTFSKAFGVYGAYICGNSTLIRYLLNKARPVMYSTALPPSVVVGIRKALEIVQTASEQRKHLATISAKFRNELTRAGLTVISGDSPIIPVIIGDNDLALRFCEALEEHNIAAVAIRPPTVPNNTARIRFSLSAAHTQEELAYAAARIKQVGQDLGVIEIE